MRLLFGLVVILSGCGATKTDAESTRRAIAHPPQAASHGAIEQMFDGPGLVCGEAFALILKADEHLTRRDPQIDFLTYRLEGQGGGFLLYEGNAPQPHDDIIQTGLTFPSVIAIHDNRSETAKKESRIRDRLIVGQQRSRLCSTAATQ